MSSPDQPIEWIKLKSGITLAIPTSAAFTLTSAAFFGATGHMYQPYTPERAQNLLDELTEHGPSTSETSLCEICAIACVGSRYSQMAISSEVGTLFYYAASNLLHTILNQDCLVGMRVCVLLAVYTVLDVPIMTVGLLGTCKELLCIELDLTRFLETGVAIGKTEMIDLQGGEENYSEPRYLQFVRDWRTLIYFKT